MLPDGAISEVCLVKEVFLNLIIRKNTKEGLFNLWCSGVYFVYNVSRKCLQIFLENNVGYNKKMY